MDFFLEVSKSRKQIMGSWILPKTKCWDIFLLKIIPASLSWKNRTYRIFFSKLTDLYLEPKIELCLKYAKYLLFWKKSKNATIVISELFYFQNNIYWKCRIKPIIHTVKTHHISTWIETSLKKSWYEKNLYFPQVNLLKEFSIRLK